MTLVVSRVTDHAALDALVPEWDALDAEVRLRTPFTSSLWNRLWLRHLCEKQWTVRDEMSVFVVRDMQHRLVGIAPMMCTTRPATGPLCMRVLQFVGADPNMTELRRVICRPDDEARVVTALMRMLEGTTQAWERVEWAGLSQPDAIEWGGLPISEGESLPMYYLQLPDSWETFRAGLSRNIKESLRKCYNSLKRDGFAETFRSVESPTEVPAAIDAFFELHRARADADVAVSHRDIFSSQKYRDFLHAYAAQLATEGRTHAFQLLIDGKIVATRIGFSFGRTLYLYYSGYDQDWAKYSVMTTTVAEALKWAIANNFDVVNLSTGTDVSKTRWGPEVSLFHSRIVQAPGTRARLVSELYRNVLRLQDRTSPVARLLGRMRRDA